MGMPADDRVKTCCEGVQVKAVKVMEKVKAESFDFDGPGSREIPGPILTVHVSPDRVNRSNGAQRGENFMRAHIPRMKNKVSALEGSERLGSNQSVGVG